MNDIKIFKNDLFGQVRTILMDGEVWFVGKDVAVALGYSNASKAVIVHVDDDDKQKQMLEADSQNGNVVTTTTLINESGLYSLVLSSKLPQAKQFKRWITKEVIPAIRKTGSYSVSNQPTLPDFSNPAEAARAWADQYEENLRNRKLIEEQQPKVEFADAITGSDSSILIGDLAKFITQNGYEIGQNRLFKWLRGHEYLCSYGKRRNTPYQQYVEQGLFEVKADKVIINGEVQVKKTTLVTYKGCQYFLGKFINK